MRALLALSLLLALPSRCDPSTTADEPVKAYLEFVRSVRKRELTKAYAELSSDTRALLDKRAQELSAASGGAIHAEPMSLFFGSNPVGTEVTEVKLLDLQDKRAKISATSGDSTQTVQLVKEADGWKVDLTEALRP